MKNIIDAHIHVNLHATKVIVELLEQMDKYDIEKSVLIVNEKQELDKIKEDIDTLKQNINRIHIVVGININLDNPFEIYNYFTELGMQIDIKLHPSLFNYKRDDFDRIYHVISRINYNVIIIDTLYFGDNIENHVGIDLGIFLAKKLKDKNIVLAHSGSIKLLECQCYTRNLSNVFYDLSFVTSYFNHTSLRMDLENFILHTSLRIMFGSDYPSFELRRALDSLYELCEEAKISIDNRNLMFYKNAEKLYFDNNL